MTFLFQPIYHQGPRGDRALTGRRGKRRRKKAPKRFVEQLAQRFDLEVPDVRDYIEKVLAREAEFIRLKEQEAEEEAQREAMKLREAVSLMMRKALIAKRKRLNMMIASIIDWL